MTDITLPDHITVDFDRLTVACAICDTTSRAPLTVDLGVPLMLVFCQLHAVHTPSGEPCGVTPSGKVTAAARRALQSEEAAE